MWRGYVWLGMGEGERGVGEGERGWRVCVGEIENFRNH